VSGQHLLPPPLPAYLQHQQHQWYPQQQQQVLQSAVHCPGAISSSSSWSHQQQQLQQQHFTRTYHSSPGALGVVSRVTPDASAAVGHYNNNSSSCPGGLAGIQSEGTASTQQNQQLQRAHAAAELGHKLPPWLVGQEQELQGVQRLQGPVSQGGLGGVRSQPDHHTLVSDACGGRGGSLGDESAAGYVTGQRMAQQELPKSSLKHPTRPAARDKLEKGGGRGVAGIAGGHHSTSSGGGSSGGSTTGRKGSIAVSGAKHTAAAAARGGASAVAAVGNGSCSPQGKRNVVGARGVGPAGRNAAVGAAAAVASRRRGVAGGDPVSKVDAGICSSPAKLRRAVVQHTQLT
jgi:hypothetical protein